MKFNYSLMTAKILLIGQNGKVFFEEISGLYAKALLYEAG
jgi:hypothetical protein